MFVIHCQDKPDSQHIRIENRPAHLEFLKSYGDMIFAAGPVQTDDRTGMGGSVLIVTCEDRAQVDAFLAADPYARAGLFASVTVLPWKKVLP